MEYAHTIGVVSGLLAALVWAIASIMYRKLGVSLHPLVLNLYKGLVATGILLVVLACRGGLLQSVPTLPLCLLLVGGAVGIGIGDAALFASLNRLGERQTMLIFQSTAPVVTVLVAAAVLDEHLSTMAFVGMGAIVAGVLWVVAERPQSAGDERSGRRAGILFGVLAAACQAAGATLSRSAFRMHDIGPLWSALIRLVGGLAVIVLLLPIARQSVLPQSARNRRIWQMVLLAAALGTFGGISLQQVAFKYTYAAVAQTVLAMTVVFVLVATRLLGEKVSLRACVGALLAVVGVGLLFWAKDGAA